MQSKYFSAKRVASLGQYLKDCESGMSYNAAWKAHKARMQEPDTITDDNSRGVFEEERKTMFLSMGEPPFSMQRTANEKWLELDAACKAYDNTNYFSFYRKPQ